MAEVDARWHRGPNDKARHKESEITFVGIKSHHLLPFMDNETIFNIPNDKQLNNILDKEAEKADQENAIQPTKHENFPMTPPSKALQECAEKLLTQICDICPFLLSFKEREAIKEAIVKEVQSLLPSTEQQGMRSAEEWCNDIQRYFKYYQAQKLI